MSWGGLARGAPLAANALASIGVVGAAEPGLGALELKRFGRQVRGLVGFKARHGHLPRAGPTAPSAARPLGMWLWRQRKGA